MRLVCLVSLALPLLFLILPLLRLDRLFVAIDAALSLSPGDIEELFGASWRTVLLSMAVAFGSASIGLVASLGVVHARKGLSRAGGIMLILPFFLGEAVIGFVMRRALDTQWSTVRTTDWPALAVLAVIVATQALRFGSLFAFIMITRYTLIGRNREDYAVVHGLSRSRFIRDVVLPSVTSTFQVCCCMAFAATMIENTTAAIVFRASPGNHVELLTHWTTRQFSLISKSSPQLAHDFVAVVGGVEFAATLMLGVAVFVVARYVIRVVAAIVPAGQFPTSLAPRWHEVAALRMLQTYAAAVVAAVVLIVWSLRHEMDLEMILALAPFRLTTALGILVCILTSVFSGLLAILCSMSWPIAFAGLTRGVVVVLASALLLSALPTSYMLQATYDWALAVLRNDHGVVAWVVGHVATISPLLFGFFIVAHFSVKAIEMDFYRAHEVPIRHVVARSFVKRFLFTYVLGAFCAFSLVWNDHTINSAFSSDVPSFASALDRAMEGRTSNLSVAAICSALSLLIGLACAYGLSARSRATT